jgi:hypothetical protein
MTSMITFPLVFIPNTLFTPRDSDTKNVDLFSAKEMEAYELFSFGCLRIKKR